MGMHTGYVHPVADGTISDLRTFALRCARAMGACIMMRDEPMDKEPPKQFEPHLDYHTERLEAAEKRLAELSTMTPEQREEAAEADWRRRVESQRKYDEEDDTEYARIKAMHEGVSAWKGAPEGLREFMLEQLGMSLERGAKHYDLLGKKLSTREWYDDAFKRAVEDVGRAHENIARERALTDSRNAWLAQLWASLPDA